MIKSLIYHKVHNFEKWKIAFDSFVEVKKAEGEFPFSVGTLQNEPNTAYVINTWESVEELEAFLKSNELAEAMKKSGVIEPPNIILLNEVDRG